MTIFIVSTGDVDEGPYETEVWSDKEKALKRSETLKKKVGKNSLEKWTENNHGWKDGFACRWQNGVMFVDVIEHKVKGA